MTSEGLNERPRRTAESPTCWWWLQRLVLLAQRNAHLLEKGRKLGVVAPVNEVAYHRISLPIVDRPVASGANAGVASNTRSQEK